MQTSTLGKRVIRNERGEISAISLGADACTEHEQGIAGIRHALGMDDDALGVARFRISESESEKLIFCVQPASGKACISLPHRSWSDVGVDMARDVIREGQDPAYVSSWDMNGFRVTSEDEEIVAFLKDFLAAAGRGDAAIMPLARVSPLVSAGCGLTILSRIPESVDREMRAAQEDLEALRAEVSAEGIEQRVRSLPAIMAFRPSRLSAEEAASKGTRHRFWIWVNSWGPALKSGWHTVEEIDAAMADLTTSG